MLTNNPLPHHRFPYPLYPPQPIPRRTVGFSGVQFNIAIDLKPSKNIALPLFDDVVPLTVQNFRNLATGQHGFVYAETSFHQIIPNVCHIPQPPTAVSDSTYIA